jgi:Xaa-Pro aminopeptidase
MVFTVEPGIYIENLGGIRLEDMVVVTDNSRRILD